LEDGVLVQESEPSDEWLDWETYRSLINRSHICLCHGALNDRPQLKGKVFEFLACGSLPFVERNSEMASILPSAVVEYYDEVEDCTTKIEQALFDKSELADRSQSGYNWYQENFDYKSFWSNLTAHMNNPGTELLAPHSVEKLYQQKKGVFLSNVDQKDAAPLLLQAELDLNLQPL